MANKHVTVGERASIFHDQTTGITVCKGDIVELNQKQLLSSRVRIALSSGHLVFTSAPLEELKKENDDKVQMTLLADKFKGLYDVGKDFKKISEAFNLQELTILAKEHDIEVEEKDTKADIAKAIFEDMEPGK